ncbi:MAG: hypothetical protein WCG95_08915 [bacterium]
MTTTKQIKANQKNALKGGVKTDASKEASKMNALKHGFFSKITTEYDKIDNEAFCKEIYACFNPQNQYEKQLVEILLSNLLTYRRICFIEKEFIETKLNPHKGMEFDHYITKGYEPVIKLDLLDDLSKFQKYKTYVQNCIYKTQHELERLTANRHSDIKIIPNALDVNITAENGFVFEH